MKKIIKYWHEGYLLTLNISTCKFNKIAHLVLRKICQVHNIVRIIYTKKQDSQIKFIREKPHFFTIFKEKHKTMKSWTLTCKSSSSSLIESVSCHCTLTCVNVLIIKYKCIFSSLNWINSSESCEDIYINPCKSILKYTISGKRILKREPGNMVN